MSGNASFDDFIRNNPNASALERTVSSFGRRPSLSYPLEDDNRYLGKLTFDVVDESKYRVELGDNFSDLWGSAYDFISGIFSGLFGSNDDGVRSAADSFYGNTNLPNKLNPRSFAPAEDFPRISLYLPQALNITDGIGYDNNMALGRIGAGVESALGTGGGAAEVGAAIAAGARETVGGIFGGKITPEVASIMAANRLGTLNSNAGTAARLASGLTTNPNTRTLFRDVPIRQFSFIFTLIATSSSEATQIENIIKAFRTEMYPEKIEAAGIDYAYRFPRRFLIRATYNNKEWPGIRFLPTYLQNLSVVYNPNGMGFHRDGKWTEVQVTMSFSESRALAKQDIEVGY
jgi:hypothetical protein